MADDAAQAYLESGGTTPHPLDAANDPSADATSSDPAQAFLESGGKTAHPLEGKDDKKRPGFGDAAMGLGEGLLHAATGGVGALGGGLTYLGTLAASGDPKAAEAVRQATGDTLTYKPRTVEGKAAASDIDDLSSYTGAREGAFLGPRAADLATKFGASPEVAGAAGATAETAANVPQFFLGAKRGEPVKGGELVAPPTNVTKLAPRTTTSPPVTVDGTPLKGLPAPELSAEDSQRSPYFDIHDPQAAQDLGIKPEKAEASQPSSALSPAQQQARMDLAKRIGLTEVRKSAIEGDAQAAADDYDATKYTDDPMGKRMRPVIAAEKTALTEHAAGIINDLGATEGSDQSSLLAKGKTMAKPLDMLSDYSDKKIAEAYDAAREHGGDEPIQFPTLDKALADRTLKNSLLARGQEGLLTGVTSQLNDFHENNPNGLSATQAEQYRQFLNTLWKTNPDAIGKLKEAMDTDMENHFGENIFGEARQLYQLKKTLLDSPKGVSQIASKDPNAPVNRTTAYEDIPDKVANMTGDQFKNLWNTYKMMPEEIQPAAQAAMAEIKGHQVNRLLDAGSKHITQWNKKGVNTELSNNSENFKTSFADDPENAARIKDLKDAGEMLRFNSAYRGAHAQKSNMLRKGVGVGAEYGGGAIGGTLGTMMAGPPGTIAGGFVGKKLGEAAASKMEDRAVKKNVESRIVSLGGP